MSDTKTFQPSGPLSGTARAPGDKSISHRALLLAALAEGTSTVTGLSHGDDVVRTANAIQAFGAVMTGDEIAGGRSTLHEPMREIYVGNSGTAMRLIAGVAASLPFLTVLIGDDSIHRRPMDRVSEPLRLMGATIDGRNGGSLAPLCIRGGNLHGIDYATPIPSAQVKGSILFAGLGAKGETVVREEVASRQHSEEMFAVAGSPTTSSLNSGKNVVRLTPQPLAPFVCDVPGDPSQAAFFVVAATVVPDSHITVENVYVGPGRATFIDVLLRMGASIDMRYRDDSEVVADLDVRSAALHGTTVEGHEIVGLIDEIPILAVAAAFATGATTFRDAAELRVKESDRVASTAAGLRALGIAVDELADGLIIEGGVPHGNTRIDSVGDHRIAMAFAVSALACDGPVEIGGFEAVDTSWPGFTDALQALCP